MTRAVNTALAVCKPNGLEYRVDPGFREVGIGIWEDVSFGYLNTFHSYKMHQFGLDPVNWMVRGSETFEQYTTRFLESMERAALQHEGAAIAIVSHSVVMRAVLNVLFPESPVPPSANTAVSCLEYENGSYRIVYLNDSSHLDKGLYPSTRQKWWQQPGAQREDTFWFREGWTDVGLQEAPHSPFVFTVMEDQRPVGLICMSEEGADIGRIDFVGLIPEYRGYDLTIQLFGEAISSMRKLGKKRLVIRLSPEIPIQALCRKLPFMPCGSSDLAMDLTRHLYSF